MEERADEWRTATDEKISELRSTMYGNGRPGLKERVTTVELEITGLREREENRMRKQDRIELAVWAAVAIAIINLIFTHFR